MTHTPEPWRLCGAMNSDQLRIIDSLDNLPAVNGGEGCVATITLPRVGVAEMLSEDQSQSYANARRIVACVNACAGIPTEALEVVECLVDLVIQAEAAIVP